MHISATREELLAVTADWPGERFPDGRPRVPDAVLDQLRQATAEQAWLVLAEHGYDRQFSGGWRETRPGTILVGRAVTSQFLPHRPDFDAAVVAAGAREGHQEGDRQNSWIIEALQDGDVMVTDAFGKIVHGTVLGDNLGTAVTARTGVGAIIDGGIRDLAGLSELGRGNIFYRDTDPTPIKNLTLAGINLPIHIGGATVLPGDIVLGTPTGLTFIPPHLAGQVAQAAADIRARDTFGKLRLAAGTYRSAEIDTPHWSSRIEADYQAWQANQLPEPELKPEPEPELSAVPPSEARP